MPKFTMSDGRAFTDYNTSCTLNKMIQEKYQVGNSHDFRYFLQRNAETVKQDLANCDPKQNCAFCPVCKSAIEYKPTGN